MKGGHAGPVQELFGGPEATAARHDAKAAAGVPAALTGAAGRVVVSVLAGGNFWCFSFGVVMAAPHHAPLPLPPITSP
eukprot:1149413-Pelagomonas_calceolata.AAC.14